jgi:hypothetical protein
MSTDLKNLLEQLTASGALSPEHERLIRAAMNDPSRLDEALQALADAGADKMGSGPPLNIEDFYREGAEPFKLQWPIGVSLPMAFAQLDRKTQFFVLFQEWTRRELEGLSALNGGLLQEAAEVFDECLQRAQQIEVGELVARSYENLAKVAENLGKREACRDYSLKAVQARGG